MIHFIYATLYKKASFFQFSVVAMTQNRFSPCQYSNKVFPLQTLKVKGNSNDLALVLYADTIAYSKQQNLCNY